MAEKSPGTKEPLPVPTKLLDEEKKQSKWPTRGQLEERREIKNG
jgi:hypothetical protein